MNTHGHERALYLVRYSPNNKHAFIDPVEYTLHWTEEEAIAYLAEIARENWEYIAGSDGVPADPDRLNDRQAVDVHFASRDGETYGILKVPAPAGLDPPSRAQPFPASPVPDDETITVTGTHGETLAVTTDFEPYEVLDGELLVKVNGPKGASKYQFTISRQELAGLWPGSPVRTNLADPYRVAAQDRTALILAADRVDTALEPVSGDSELELAASMLAVQVHAVLGNRPEVPSPG